MILKKMRYTGKYGGAWPVAAILFCAACFLFGCGKDARFATPPRPVRVGTVMEKDVPVFIDSFGTLNSPHVVDVKSRVTGEIEEILFSEGQFVSRGDLLARIDSRQYKANLDKAEAALQQALVELKIKQDTLERNSKLIRDELISTHEFDQYKSDTAAAESMVALRRAELEAAKLDLEFCSIVSPVDGVLGKRQVDPGNIVSANTGPTLVNVRMMDPLYVDFTVSERDLGRVRSAMDREKLDVRFSVDGVNTGEYSGVLQFIENTVDDSTGTVFLRAVVSNGDKSLWPGQFVKVRLFLDVMKGALVVPGASVQLGKDGYYLFVINKDNKADLRVVSIGQRSEEYVVIEKGVTAGETVVTYGQLGLAPKASVRVVPDTEKQAVQPSDS